MKSRRTLVGAAIAVAVAAGAGLGWAGRTLLSAPAPLPRQQAFSVVDATEGVVSRSLRLTAQARWSGGGSVGNLAEGTITAARISGSTSVKPGQPLYDVDLRAVSVAEGKVPAFRAMTVGTSGADVAQLQGMLRGLGLRTSVPDGRFGVDTARQVRAWQRSTGQDRTGEVALGSVLFVPKLPATVVLGDGLAVGRRVSAATGAEESQASGEDAAARAAAPGSASDGSVIRLLPAAPAFSITLPENQARLARVGMGVTIERAGKSWRAVIGSISEPGQDGSAVAALKSPTSAAICGAECPSIPVNGASGLGATIVIVPEAKGVVVPAAALVLGADGTTAVQREDGTRVPVTVKASAGGRSVIEGIDAGTKVRVSGGS